MHYWLAKRSPRREKDKRNHDRTGGERYQGQEIEGKIDATNLPPKDL